MLKIRIIALFCLTLPTLAFAQNDAGVGGNDSGPDDVLKPIAVWHFDGQPHAGPRPPVYSGFGAGNTAGYSDGKGALVSVKGSGDGVAANPGSADRVPPPAQLRFGQGDSIAIEAWVKVKEIPNGNLVYIVGKGRAKANTKNQNYALRLKGDKGTAKVSFLFATAAAGDTPAGWHRWTTDAGFAIAGGNSGAGDGWHHVAVSYTFGKPDSARGYVDGQTSGGQWDMEGPTELPPVQDDDDLLLGTGNGGGKSNSYVGWMDEVAIWRVALPEEVLIGRYPKNAGSKSPTTNPIVAEPVVPPIDRKTLPAGKVLVQICEQGMPATNAWPEKALPVSENYTEDAFGFFEEPQKYVDTGVRDDRPNPHLFRAAAVVNLPDGKHRLLLRGRGSARLMIDGKLVLSTQFPSGDTSGHGHVSEQQKYLDLGPDFRFRPPGNRETWCEFESKGGEHLVVLETIVGGYAGAKAKRRPELGETVVALSRQGTESFELLSPISGKTFAYTDAGWTAYQSERQTKLDELNAATRAKLRAENAAYWDKRREAAKVHLAATPETSAPALPAGFTANNPIDQFVAARIAGASAQMADAKKGTIDYFQQVRPIMEAKCFSCHQGGKAKGKLRLDELAAALKGGSSGDPAIVLGHPEKSPLIARITTNDEDEVMPPKGDRLTKAEVAILETWVREGAHWPEFRAVRATPAPLADDLAFLRRVTLDTVGVVPSLPEIEAFLADKSPNKRAAVIDRLLKDPRWADQWMGYWQDVLAENPNILNPTLNNTGPFRWWIYESLADNKPMDLFVTELLRMRGSERFGGPAGFGVASQNDVPMAAKGTIVSTAFLGVEMKCARCHDAPSHKSLQLDLFQLASSLAAKPLIVPPTSSVPMDKIHAGGRKPLIQVTLKPGTKVDPKWPFAEFCDEATATKLAEQPNDPRDRLAAAITAPQNERFAQVIANRIWARFMGRGIVEPVEDWEKGRPTHPELLRWLGRELVRGGYDAKHVARLILNSQAYQRATDPTLSQADPLYAAAAPRHLSAEQIVDSLFAATGKPFRTEEASLDIDSIRDMNASISLGQPRRAWMLTSTSNERDRPSLSLPRLQAVADVLSAFGWRGSRQDPASRRDDAPNSLQPAILSNGVMATWLTTLSDDHGITQLALRDQSAEQFVDTLFLKLLTRRPTADERKTYVEYLKEGYEQRKPTPSPGLLPTPAKRKPPLYVSWSNHLDPEATIVRQQEEVAARRGDPPTQQLSESWRKRMEDVLWSMLNAPEWVFTP